MTVATSDELAYFAAHGCALFPCRAGTKVPTIAWKAGSTTEASAWSAWRAAGDNLAIDCAKSGLIIVDVDSSKVSRAEAWAAWHRLATSWGFADAPAPMTQSARGGWHIAFKRPAALSATELRGGGTLVKVSDVRDLQEGEKDGEVIGFKNRGYCVAPGSVLATPEGTLPYLLMPGAPAPHDAPPGLVELVRLPLMSRTNSPHVGAYDIGDVKDLYKWMLENGGITTDEEWYQAGMIAKIECGDAGLDVWSIICHNEYVDDKAMVRWNSFASDPRPGVAALGSLMKRAHALGWRGQVRKTTGEMFAGVAVNTSAGVAQIAAAAGATLSSASQAMPLADTQRIVAALGQPVLDNFLAGTTDAPARPMSDDFPTLPETLQAHPLYELLLVAIARIIAMAEGGSKFRQGRVLPTLGVLHGVHPTVCEHVCQRIVALGGVISPAQFDSAVKAFEGKVRAEIRTSAGFILNTKGEPAPENSDNVHVFLRQRSVKFRINTWKDQIEVSDADRDAYAQLTDRIANGLLVDAENSQFNYHPSEGRFRRGIEYAASGNLYDPLRERMDELATKWDGVARLDQWLTRCVGVAPDAYHVAVGRNLLGGLVRRARHPGCEQAETVIFISPTQGTGKSTLCKILAIDPTWHTDSLRFGGSQQNTIPQMAGKWVIELSELAGMNKSAVEEIKNFMSATTDNYTKKYQAFATDHPRRCCFVGTSNEKRPLADSTGGRRFLPVHVVGEVDTDWLRANIEQLYGECATREAAGESFAIPRAVWALAGSHQDAARAMSPVEELCYEWFDRPPAQGLYVTATDIVRALKMAGQAGRYSGFLDKLGWRSESLVVPVDGRKCRVWVRHDNNKLDECVRLEPIQAQVNARVEMRMRPVASGAPSSMGVPLPPISN